MERSKSLSINSVKRYKFFLMGSLSIMFLAYMTLYLIDGDLYGVVMVVVYLALMIFYWYPNIGKFLKKIKEVSYDKENLYVQEGTYEIQIPFHEVKDIEIVSLDGLYKFKLYQSDQFGDEVICKPSLWYPLNYKKVDAELNRIRGLVRKAHHEYTDKIGFDRSLPSN
ncbi:MAG: hypothetical protein ABJG47_14565 [Ekhidna sp.]